MNPRYTLVTAISLLYTESLLENSGNSSSDLVRKVIDHIPIPEVSSSEAIGSREVLMSLRDTAIWLCTQPQGMKIDKHSLLQRIRIDTGGEEALYASFSDLFATELERERLLEMSGHFRSTLYGYLNKVELENIIRESNREIVLGGIRTPQDMVRFCRDLAAKIEPFTNGGEDSGHPAFVGEVDLSDLSSVTDTMTKAQAEMSSEGIIRFGSQGVNRMFGNSLGARRGEFIVVGALQHNYKSGFCLSLLKQAALYNKPYMRDPTKKPLILRISLENELNDDIMWLYKSLKENETGELCDIRTADIQEAGEYVRDKMTANGYHFIMRRYDPSDFGFHDLFDVINKLEAEGYEIHLLNIDYLNMMTKRGCTQGPTGSDTRDLFRRVRNFTSKRGITCITPHQLSTEAKQLVRNGVEYFVKEIANKGYWDSCRTLDQEVDMELYLHLEKNGGVTYLTIQRGKHRKVEVTDPKDLYTVLRMHPIGGILDDVNGPDTSLRHVGGSAMSEGGDSPWWATAAA